MNKDREVFEPYVTSRDGYDIIGLKETQDISSKLGLTARETEALALKEKIVPSRYLANVKFFGIDNQRKLLDFKAIVIGCGAVGGMACEILARLGFGQIHMVDFDVFDETNLNRQLMCTEQDIGKSKVECAKNRVLSVNSAINAVAHNVRLDDTNAAALISGCDIVFDGLDNARDKLTLEKSCLASGIPLIHGAIGDSTFQVAAIKNNPILKNVYAGGLENPVFGTPACTAIACAAAQAGEALKILLDIGASQQNSILRYDWVSLHCDAIELDLEV